MRRETTILAIVGTLAPMLSERGATLATIDHALAKAQTALSAIRAAHYDDWPTLSNVKPKQLKKALAALATTSNATQALPAALPTAPPEAVPR